MAAYSTNSPQDEYSEVRNYDSVNQALRIPYRVHYFDWLRAIAVLGIIAYHALLPFARDTWNIANNQQSPGLSAFLYILESFGLGVLFLIAGASARFALQRRSMSAFFTERVKRLLVPFFVGAIFLIPPTSYMIGLHNGTVSGSFFSFLADYPRALWTNYIAATGVSPEILTYIGMHLWFLGWLFICSIVAIPVFIWLLSPSGKSFIASLGRHGGWRGALLLLGLLLAVPRILLSLLPPAISGWSLEAFVWYGLVFVSGYVMFSDERLIDAARRDSWLALIIALLGSIMFLVPNLVWQLIPWTYNNYPFWMGLMGFTGWAWTLVIIGIGMHTRFMQKPLHPLINEASLPAYLLHFTIVIGISAFVVSLPLALGTKALINAVVGVCATLLVALGIIRIQLFRPLLGLTRKGTVSSNKGVHIDQA